MVAGMIWLKIKGKSVKRELHTDSVGDKGIPIAVFFS
jgi:hypothetical protein